MPRQAQAEPARALLVYTRGAGAEHCPEEVAVRRAVEARLGANPFVEPPQITIRALVAREEGALKAHLVVESAEGEPRGIRDFASRQNDCSELAAAMQLAIAIAIDPLVITRLEPAEPPKAAEPPVPPPAPPPSCPPETSERPVIQASLGAALEGWAAPSASVGFTLGLGARWERFSLGVEGRADLSASTSVKDGKATTSLIFGSVIPCFRLSGFGGCLLLSGGGTRCAGEGLQVSRQQTTPYFAVGGRLLYEIALARFFSLRFHGDLAAPVTRTTLLSNGSPVWRSPPVSVALGIGAVATL